MQISGQWGELMMKEPWHDKNERCKHAENQASKGAVAWH